IGLLLGIVIGLFIGNVVSNSAATTAGGPTTAAPALTPDQLNTQQLPAGHPSVSGAPGAAGSSTTATKTK
ncbi:MAG TPA: hypothetical protein VIK32_02975, partial [Candidatus Limnocylindrales bacterium]